MLDCQYTGSERALLQFPSTPLRCSCDTTYEREMFLVSFFVGGAFSNPLGMRADKMYVPAAKRADLWDARL